MRTVIRLAGGDLNAVAGIAGLISGIFVGVLLFKRGFNFSRTSKMNISAGWIAPLGAVILLVLVIAKPDFIYFSNKGWASEHAALPLSLGAGLIVGFLFQRSRMCFMGAWRDIFLVKNTYLVTGLIAALVSCLALNVFLGQFHVGFTGQEGSVVNQWTNYFGMVLVGVTATMLGACPLRQLVLSGEGDTDAAVTVLGMLVGAALIRSFGMSNCEGDVMPLNPLGVGVALLVVLAIGYFIREK